MPRIAGDDKDRSTPDGRCEEYVIIGVGADSLQSCWINMDHVLTGEPQVESRG